MIAGGGHPPVMKTADRRRFIAYVRVSTQQQGKSGLGLEAQREAINAFLRPTDTLVLPIFTEVESGRNNDRPELAKALAKCRTTGATLLVAKLDRLSRDVSFLRAVVDQTGEGGVVFCDLPNIPAGPMGKFLLTQMAAVAELEAGLIRERTKAALAAAKARGVKLGGVRKNQRPPTHDEQKRGAQIRGEAMRLAADQAAYSIAPRAHTLRAEGLSLAAIAAALAAEGIPTPRKGAWTATSVRRLLARLEGMEPAAHEPDLVATEV